MTKADHFCLNPKFSYIPSGTNQSNKFINSRLPGCVFHATNPESLRHTHPKAGKDKQRCKTGNQPPFSQKNIPFRKAGVLILTGNNDIIFRGVQSKREVHPLTRLTNIDDNSLEPNQGNIIFI